MGDTPPGAPSSWRWLVLGLLLLAAVELTGCGMGTTELPATTQPGGPGFLSITTPEIADGVESLSYSATINTAGGSGRLASCTVISGSLPPGFGDPLTVGSQCVLSTAKPAAVAPGHYSFTLEAGDTSTPQRTDNHVYSLTIRPSFTIKPPVVPDAVAGRSYKRTFTVATNLQNHAAGQSTVGSAEAGNGPATNCSLAGLPAVYTQVSCAIDSSGVNTTVTMNAGAATLAPGVYPFTISVTDSPIPQASGAGGAVPAETVTLPLSLAVRAEFAVTQPALADGVQGRTYGVSPLAQPAQTNVVAVAPPSVSGETTELGNGPLTRCALSVSPTDAALAVAVDPANRSRCLITNAPPVAAAGTYSVAVSATDSPILDPASGQVVVPANTMTKEFAWVVNQPISYTLNFDSAAGQPGQAPDAVQGRTYGAPAKTPLIVTATGGLSTTDGLSVVQGGTLPTGASCVNESPTNPQPPGAMATLTCGSNGQLVGAPSGATNFTVTVSDSGNSATPGGSISQDVNGHTSHLLNVDAPLGLAASIADPLPPAVSGRSYAVAPSTPLVYTASGGLGGYHFTTPADTASPAAAFPQGIACVANPTTFACSASAITAAGSTTAYGPVPVTLNDTANQTAPDGGTSSPVTTATVARTLLVNPPLTITPSGSATPEPPPGVVGRTYGSGAGFTPLVYTVTGGDPPYTFTSIPSVSAPAPNGFPAPVSCVVGNAAGQTTPDDQFTCAGANGVSAATGSYPFTVSVEDAGSAGTLPASTSLSQSVTINPALSLTPQSSTIPLAVVGRTYGDPGAICNGAACQPVGYNISGGLGGYSESTANPAAVTLSGFPGAFTCAFTSTGSLSGTYACSTASAVAGSSPSVLSITATDTANSATPRAPITNAALSLQVNQPLTLTPPAGEAPVPAVSGRAYGSGSGCSGGACKPVVYDVANGTQTYPASATLTTTAGAFTCALSGTTYNCGSSGISLNPSTPTTVPLDASVTDVANASTPSRTTPNSSLSLTVNPALSATGPSGTLAIAVSGRTYGSGSNCGSGGTSACAAISYTVSNGLGGYGTPPTLNGYPASFACPFTSTGALSASYACASSTGVPAVSTSTNDTVSLTITDTANASTPSGSITTSTATLPVNPVLSFSPPSTVNPAVQGRAYGTGSGCSGGACQPLSYGIANGTGNFASPATMSTTAGSFSCPLISGSNYNCSSGSITGASSAGLNISVSDLANTSTPAGSASDSSKSLAVDAPLSSTGPSGTLVVAVSGRTYGSGSNCGSGGASSCSSIGYTVANGLGGYSGSTSNPTPPTLNGYPSSFTCPFTSTGALSGSYACASTTGVPAVGTTVNDTVSLTISDTANTSTPSGSTTTGTATLPVNPVMTIAPATGQGTPAIAVAGRTYGSSSGCAPVSACAPIKYTVSGGLGNYAAFAALSATPQALSGVTCPISGATYSCSASPLTATGLTAETIDTLSVTTTETGNASTPSATTAPDTSLSLTVNPEISFTTFPSTLWPDGVVSRTYGNGASGGCTASTPPTTICSPVIQPTGGLGPPYNFQAPTSLPTGVTCSVNTPTDSMDTCYASGLGITGAAGSYTPDVPVTDNANASTPAISRAKSYQANFKVDNALAIQQTALPNALIDYTYSASLTAQNGLGGYGWVLPGGSATGACSVPTGPAPTGLAASSLTGSPITLNGPLSPASTKDTDFTFGVCLADTANQATPAGFALPNNTPQKYTVNVFNRYAFIADPGAGDIRLIDTGTGSTSPSIPIPPPPITVSQTNLQGSVVVTPNGLYAFFPLTGTNGFAVFDTITDAALPKSPFQFPTTPVATPCTSPVGVAFSLDSTKAYFACSGNSEVVEVDISSIAGVSGTVKGVASSAATTGTPVAIAVSPDGNSLYVVTSGAALELLTYAAAPLATAPATTVSLLSRETPVAIALASNSTNTYAYIAETKSGSPGQVEVINVTSGTSVTGGSPIGFSAIVSTNPEPSCIAVTPDNKRVYVGLQGTDTFAVIDNTLSKPAQISKSFLLPTAASQTGTKLGNSSPNGISIPPLATLPSTGYRVFFTSINSGSGEVDVINDNSGSPTANATLSPNFGSTSTPQGIAAIPVPTLP